MARKKKPVAKKRKVAQAPEKAKHTEAIKKLKPIAKDVNARLASADKTQGKVDDMRLGAALRLAEAKKVCDAAKLPFKKWCEENVDQGYANVRELAMVGASKNPQLALEDMRAKTARRVAKSRAKGKSAAPSSPSAGGNARVTSPAADPPWMIAMKASETMDDATRGKLSRAIAETVGLQVLSPGDADKLKQGEATVRGAKFALKRLDPMERRELLVWLTEQVEQDVADASKPAGEMEMPASLKRGKTSGRKKRKSA